jgi:hypothetical protein
MTAPSGWSIEIQDGARHLRMKIGRPASPSWIDENAATPDIHHRPVAPMVRMTASFTSRFDAD